MKYKQLCLGFELGSIYPFSYNNNHDNKSASEETKQLQYMEQVIIIISSSCRAISTDISDPFSPPLPIIHCFRQVLKATPHILTELLYEGLSWLPCFCLAM